MAKATRSAASAQNGISRRMLERRRLVSEMSWRQVVAEANTWGTGGSFGGMILALGRGSSCSRNFALAARRLLLTAVRASTDMGKSAKTAIREMRPIPIHRRRL